MALTVFRKYYKPVFYQLIYDNAVSKCRCLGSSHHFQKSFFVQNNHYHSESDGKSRSQYGRKSWVMGLTTFGLGFGLGLAVNYLSDSEDSIKLSDIIPRAHAAKPTSPDDASGGDYSIKLSDIIPRAHAAKPTSPDDASGGDSGDLIKGKFKMFNFIADIVEKRTAPVVYIEIMDNRRVDFFRTSPVTVSNGSGFIVQEDGLILTNAHVVVNSPHTTVHVRLHNGQRYQGTVEEVDLKSDLATVRINCKGLPVMPLGKSSELRPGEFVVAIGSPLTLSNTVTAGVVSSVNRQGAELGLHGRNMEYIQTDAAITFGNSGGPLLNLDGEAIGINSMKVAAGISFAIPIDYAKEFLVKAEEKRRKGPGAVSTPKRKYMGITMLTLTPDIISQLQTKRHEVPPDVTHGVLTWKVVLDSPAYAGGLKPGDIITHVNGTEVSAASHIYNALDKYSSLVLIVVRGMHRLELVITPEEY